jgi:hypothetical protein
MSCTNYAKRTVARDTGFEQVIRPKQNPTLNSPMKTIAGSSIHGLKAAGPDEIGA